MTERSVGDVVLALADKDARVGLAEEGVGTTTIGVDWTPGAELADRTVWTQRANGKREPDQLKRLREPDTAASALKATLRTALAESDDSRAVHALNQLRKHKPDLDLVSGIATGTHPPAGDLAALRELATLVIPGEDAVRTVAQAVRDALAALAEHSDTALVLAGRTAGLLRRAIDLHHDHGTMSCPVCGQGILDDDWLATATARAAETDTRIQALTAARDTLANARTDAHRLVKAVPMPAHCSCPAPPCRKARYGSSCSTIPCKPWTLGYRDDARALVSDGNVPSSLIDKILPGLCRRAVEAAARQRYYREQLTTGADRARVERTWSDNTSTTRRVSLALFGDPESPAMVAWRNAMSWRKRTLKLCTVGLHQGENVARDAVPDLDSTLRDILPDRP